MTETETMTRTPTDRRISISLPEGDRKRLEKIRLLTESVTASEAMRQALRIAEKVLDEQARRGRKR